MTHLNQPQPEPTHQPPYFPTHTLDSAPPEARGHLRQLQQKFGFIPLPSARHATAPAALEAFHHLHRTFNGTSLSGLEREAVALVLAGKLDCKLCRDLHRRLAHAAGATHEEIDALVSRSGISEPRLAALATFTERLVETRGDVTDDELEAFIDAGFTARQALEVIVGIATYTLSIFANRLTKSESMR